MEALTEASTEATDAATATAAHDEAPCAQLECVPLEDELVTLELAASRALAGVALDTEDLLLLEPICSSSDKQEQSQVGGLLDGDWAAEAADHAVAASVVQSPLEECLEHAALLEATPTSHAACEQAPLVDANETPPDCVRANSVLSAPESPSNSPPPLACDGDAGNRIAAHASPAQEAQPIASPSDNFAEDPSEESPSLESLALTPISLDSPAETLTRGTPSVGEAPLFSIDDVSEVDSADGDEHQRAGSLPASQPQLDQPVQPPGQPDDDVRFGSPEPRRPRRRGGLPTAVAMQR